MGDYRIWLSEVVKEIRRVVLALEARADYQTPHATDDDNFTVLK